MKNKSRLVYIIENTDYENGTENSYYDQVSIQYNTNIKTFSNNKIITSIFKEWLEEK